MSSPRNRLYDSAKDRHYASLFFFTLVGFVVALIIFRHETETAFFVAGAFLLIWGGVGGRGLFIRGDRGQAISQLSSDELAKARSKLLKNRERKHL